MKYIMMLMSSLWKGHMSDGEGDLNPWTDDLSQSNVWYVL